MLVNGEKINCDHLVPDGCTAQAKDQFAASPTVMDYESITFHLDGLHSRLSKYMDELGCTSFTLQKLIAAKKVINTLNARSSARQEKWTSPLSNRMTGPVSEQPIQQQVERAGGNSSSSSTWNAAGGSSSNTWTDPAWTDSPWWQKR